MLTDLQTVLGQNIKNGVLALSNTVTPLGDVGTFITTMSGGSLNVTTAADSLTLTNQILTLAGTVDAWAIKGVDNTSASKSLTNIKMTFTFQEVNAQITSSFTLTADLMVGTVSVPVTGVLNNQKEVKLALSESMPIALTTLATYISNSQLSSVLPQGVDVFTTVTLSIMDIVFGFDTAIDTSFSVTATIANKPWTIEGIKAPLTISSLQIDVSYISVFDGNISMSYSGNINGIIDIDNNTFNICIYCLGNGSFEFDFVLQANQTFPDVVKLGTFFGGSALVTDIQAGVKELGLDTIKINGIRVGFSLGPSSLNYIDLNSSFVFQGCTINSSISLYPAFSFYGSMAPGTKIDLHKIGQYFFPDFNIFPVLDIIELSLSANPSESNYTFSIAVSDPWSIQILNESVALSKIQLYVQKEQNGFSGSITGMLALGSMNVFVEAYSPTDNNGWVFKTNTQSGGQIAVGELIGTLAQQFGSFAVPPSLNALTLGNVQVSLSFTSKDFSCSGYVLDDWNISVANIKLALDDVNFAFNYTGGKSIGSVTATSTIADNDINLNLNLPGNFLMQTTIPSANLADLANQLCGSFIDVPQGMPAIIFTDSQVLIAEVTQGTVSEFKFSLNTNLSQLGSMKFPAPLEVVFETLKMNDKCGFVAGFDLPDSWSPAQIWSEFASVFSDLTFSNTGMVISSVANPQISFENFSGKTVPATIQEGITFFTDLAFSGAFMTDIKKLIGDIGSLQMEAVIASDPAQTKVIASLGTQKSARNTVSFESLQLVFAPSTTNVSLDAEIAVKLGSDTLNFKADASIAVPGAITFDFALTGQNGVDGTGWKNPFGVDGLTIDAMGLEISLADEVCVVGLQGKIILGSGVDAIDLDLGGGLIDFEEPAAIIATLEPASPQKGKITLPSLIGTLTSFDLESVPLLSQIVLKDFKFYMVDDPAGFKSPIDPTFVYQPGVALEASIVFFGMDALVDLNVSKSTGVYAKGCLGAINLMDVVILTDATGKKGASALIDTSSSADKNISISGLVSLFDIEKESVNAYATKDGFVFDLTYDLAGLEEFTLNCWFTNAICFGAKGTVNLGIDKKIDLGFLSITLDAEIKADIVFSLTYASFLMDLGVSFEFLGESFSFSFPIKVKFDKLAQLPEQIGEYIEQEAKKIFGDILGDFTKVLTWAKDGAIFLEKGFANAVTDVYKKTKQDFIRTLNDINCAATEAAYAVDAVYNLAAADTAKLMQQGKYLAADVGTALKTVYNVVGDDAAKMLKGAGYAATDVCDALNTAYGFTDDQATAALKDAGYLAGDVTDALSAVYKETGTAATALEKAAGFVFKTGGGVVKKILSIFGL